LSEWWKRLFGGREADAQSCGDRSSPANAAVAGDPLRVQEVEAVLAELRPMFRADAGDIELAAIEGGWVVVRLRGACVSCHASDMTLHAALEPRLKARFPWVTGVRVS
jgi:Fe-S cluster biogenesis protein NfuA